MAKQNLLNSQEVEKIKPKEKRFEISDGGGLVLRIFPTGTKTWRLRYTLAGKERVLVLGNFPDISLAKARTLAGNARALVMQKIDPAQEKREAIAAIEKADNRKNETFKALTQQLLTIKEKDGVTAITNQKTLRRFEMYLFPAIGNLHITEIEYNKHLKKIFEGIASEISNRGKPQTYTAKKLCGQAAEVFDLAIANDLFHKPNPCRANYKYLPSHQEENMRQIPHDELGILLRKIDTLPDGVVKQAMNILLWTGFRQVSARRVQWKDIDLAKGLWHRQPEKTDGRTHTVPLPKQAQTMLQEMYESARPTDQDLVFPSPLLYRRNEGISDATINSALDTLGLKGIHTGHGFRGAVITGLQEIGYDKDLTKFQVGQKVGDAVFQRYNRAKYMPVRIEMMQHWANYLDGLRVGNVVPIKAA